MHHTSSYGKMPHRPLLAPPPFPQPPVAMSWGRAQRKRIAGPFRWHSTTTLTNHAAVCQNQPQIQRTNHPPAAQNTKAPLALGFGLL